MKTTIKNIKSKIAKLTSNTGLILSKNNPYWANDEQIKSIESAIEQIKAEGEDAPDRRYEITPRQTVLLLNWVDSLKTKFLFNL